MSTVTSYALSSEEINAKASSLEAERICFKSEGEFTFATPETTEVDQKIALNLEGRIKYQRRDEGRWVDCSTYSFVLDAKQLFVDMAGDAFRGQLQCSTSEMLAAKTIQPRRFHTALRTILRKLHDRASKSFDPKIVNRILGAFDSLLEIEDEFFSYFVSTLKYQRLLFTNGLKEVIESPDHETVHRLLTQLDSMEGASSSVGHCVALGNIRAKLLSLVDRDGAAREFSAMLELDVLGLIEFFYTDMGSFTYLSEADLSSDADKLATSIVESIESQDSSQAASSTAIVMSADPRFFRIYGHLMMFYAQQLPTLDFVFVLVGDRKEASDAILAARSYVDTLSAFNASGSISNLRFFWCPVPDFVTNEKTFFATSRFFAASKLLNEYAGVYIIDIDLQFNDDPTQFIRWLHGRTFACSDNRGLYRLSPWRRHLAGNVFMRQDISQQFVTDLQKYIVTGLQRKNSWMMDQNALTFAIERSFAGNDVSTAPFGRRPTSQPSFRSVWEANFASNMIY